MSLISSAAMAGHKTEAMHRRWSIFSKADPDIAATKMDEYPCEEIAKTAEKPADFKVMKDSAKD